MIVAIWSTIQNTFLFLFKDQTTFWTALGSLATFGAVLVALKPIREKAQLGKALFKDAVQVDVSRDGVLTVFNIFDEPITIKSIAQALIKGSDLGLTVTSATTSIAHVLKSLPNRAMIRHEFTRSIPPKLSFVYASSLTHLPAGFQTQSLWVVKTKIKYQSPKGNTREKQIIHRFSIRLEPRLRWVEVFS